LSGFMYPVLLVILADCPNDHCNPQTESNPRT
jgi:hypothetical protein